MCIVPIHMYTFYYIVPFVSVYVLTIPTLQPLYTRNLLKLVFKL